MKIKENNKITELSEEELKDVNGGLSTACEVGGPRIRVRGKSSVGSSEPLYIIDGVATAAGLGGGIEPDNIETVKKD